MNRSILIVVCDFLLLSLLALARFDSPTQEIEEAEQALGAEESAVAENVSHMSDDLIEVLRLSLDVQKASQETLSSELSAAQEALAERERMLREREAALQETAQSLREQEEAARKLAAEREQLQTQQQQLIQEKQQTEEEHRLLVERYTEAQRQIETVDKERLSLARELGEAREQSTLTAEQLKALQESLREREELLAKAKAEMEELASSRRMSEEERREVETRLKIAETERRMLAENLQVAQLEVETIRREREQIEADRRAMEQTTSRLADGVGALAESTRRISEEVRQSQPLSLNAIFQKVRENRVQLRFAAENSGLLGTTSSNYAVETVLVGHEDKVYALMHTAKTPFVAGTTSLATVRGQLQLGEQRFRINQVTFFAADPRLVAVPVPQAMAENSGVEVFTLAADPLRYPDAVLIGSEENYYGETPFRLDPESDRFIRMQSSLINDLFGEFSPRQADLVFSRTGEVLGMMVNRRFAIVLDGLRTTDTLDIGTHFNPERARQILQRQQEQLSRLPSPQR